VLNSEKVPVVFMVSYKMYSERGGGLEPEPQFGFAAPRSRSWSRKKYFRLHNTALFNIVICRPSDSSVSEDAGIKPRAVATLSLAGRRSNHPARSHPRLGKISSTTRLDIILDSARSHPHPAKSHQLHSILDVRYRQIQNLCGES
jgi:hypothetical protein